MEILIVEDEPLTAQFIKQTLGHLGYSSIQIADNADAVNEIVETNSIELIFMDINIKGRVDGLQLALSISANFDTKIIFLTSYHDSQTIFEASLSKPLGYLIKPIIRSDIEAIMMVASTQIPSESSQNQKDSPVVAIGNLSYNFKTKSAIYDKKSVKLSKLEIKTLELFLENINIVISSETLINQIWGDERSKSSLRELISRLRKKLPDIKLESHSNRGYILYS